MRAHVAHFARSHICLRYRAEVFVGLDIPAHAVEAVVHEIPKSHWGVGRQPASEWGVGGPPAGEPAWAQGAGVRGPTAGAEQI